MSEKPFNPERNKDLATADEFEDFLGDEKEDPLYKRLLYFWRKRGKEAAKQFCINDADKFDFLGRDSKVQLYLEDKLFDAGPDGLLKKTPWNNIKRQKAGLPYLYEFE